MCGIAAFIGKKDPESFKYFNEAYFKYIAWKQDSRGGDNCGVIYHTQLKNEEKSCMSMYKGYNDKYLKKTHGEDESTLENYFEFIREKLAAPVPPYSLLAHARKASVGMKGVDNAHPFIIRADKSHNLVGVMNGTVYNWKEIAETVGTDVSGTDNDSKAIFQMVHEGHLEEVAMNYRGGMALVWLTAEDYGTYYVYVSGYKSYQGKETQDRPLHYIKTKAGIYISSLATHLDAISTLMGWGEVTELATPFPINTLLKVTGDSIEVVKTYEKKLNTSAKKKEKSNVKNTRDTTDSSRYLRIAEEIAGGNNQTLLTSGDVLSRFTFDKYPLSALARFKQDHKIYLEQGIYKYDGDALNCGHKISSKTIDELREGLTSYVEVLEKGLIKIEPRYISKDGTLLDAVGISEFVYAGTKLPYTASYPDKSYFYNGMLVRNFGAMIALLCVKYKLGALSPRYLTSYSDYPVRFRMAKNSTSNSETFLTKSDLVREGSDAVSCRRAEGYFKYPFIEKGYYFIKGKLAEIMIPETGNMKDFQEAKEEGCIWYCPTCSRAVPGEADCFTCETGVHRNHDTVALAWDEHKCNCCQITPMKGSWEMCKTCLASVGKDGKLRKEIDVLLVDKRPKFKSSHYDKLKEYDKKKAEEHSTPGISKLYEYVCSQCGTTHSKDVDECATCYGITIETKEKGWVREYPIKRRGSKKKKMSELEKREYMFDNPDFGAYKIFFDHFLEPEADLESDGKGKYSLTCPKCAVKKENMEYTDLLKIPKCSHCENQLVVDVKKDISGVIINKD